MRYRKTFLFRVYIDGVERAQFQSCSKIRGEYGDIEILEGGALSPDFEPGLLRWDDITLSRGRTGDKELYDLFASMYEQVSVDGVDVPVGQQESDSVRLTFDIVEVNRKQEELARHRVQAAYIKAFETGDWDNTSEEKQMDTVVFKVVHVDMNV